MFVVMLIATYISDLLYRHECVVIPDFGALISRRVPAQHFASSHTLYPPKKGLSFNEQIKQNDGLLVNYITSVEQIPYEAAQQQVRNYVRFLDHEIDEKGAVTVHKVGRFTRSAEGALQFTPMYLVNYLPEAFGLASLEAFAIDHTPVMPVAAAQEQVAPAAIVVDETPVIALETPKTKSPSWVRYAAAAAVLVAGSYVGFNAYQSQQDASTLLVEQMADAQFKNQVQEASFLITNPLPSLNLSVAAVDAAITDAVAPVKTTYYHYHVIAGAYRNPANATKKVRELEKLGYTAQRIGVNKYGLHNVAFSSFNSRNEATNELIRLKAAGFTNAWLLTGSL